MPSATAFVGLFVGLIAMAVGALYVFGIPPALKRTMEEKALETMGENKASYLMKGMSISLRRYLCLRNS
jgi:hypothetical protein